MKKIFILSYSSSLGTYDQILDFINKCGLITTWRKELPNLFFIVSEFSAHDISTALAGHFEIKDGVPYLVAEITENCQGLLDERSWALINDKKLPPKGPVPKLQG